jgi:hypothetical protein
MEAVHKVGAGAVILARLALTLVNVRLAVPPVESHDAVALIALSNQKNR